MTDLRERAPAREAMEKLVSFRGSEELTELPFGLVRISPLALNWLRGVRGELFMARRLAKLGPEWVVLHSVPVGDRGSDIDHIVIGPPGVFPINTKRLIDREVRVDGDRFRSGGWKQHYLPKSAHEARRVINVLDRAGVSAPVLPIIAISGASSVKNKSDPRWEGVNIGVAPVEKVVGKLKRRKRVLSPQAVAGIADILSDSAVWSSRTPAPHDPELYRAYRRIDRGVGLLGGLVFTIGGAIIIGAFWWSSSMFAGWLTALYQR